MRVYYNRTYLKIAVMAGVYDRIIGSVMLAQARDDAPMNRAVRNW